MDAFSSQIQIYTMWTQINYRKIPYIIVCLSANVTENCIISPSTFFLLRLHDHQLSTDPRTLYFFLPMVQQPLVGQGLLIIEASRLHSDTPHSLGLLWTSDQPDAETYNWQHTTFTRDRHPCPPTGIRTHNPRKRAAVDPHLRHEPYIAYVII
jgi:hypothetical protein